MHTEKVKSNEKRPENKLGCAFCISFQYKIKRKFTLLGANSKYISSCAATPLNEIYLVFILGGAEIFPLFIL